MKLHFYLRFSTQPGQFLSITGNIPGLGNGNAARSVPMQYLNKDFWHLQLECPALENTSIYYKYQFTNTDGFRIDEWGNDRCLQLTINDVSEICVVDTWNHAGSYENAFFTAPFQKILLENQSTKKIKKEKNPFTHVFNVKAPLLHKHEVVCITGSGNVLGDWQIQKPVLLQQNGNWWSVALTLPNEHFPLQYKYGIYNTREKLFVQFENGANRYLFNKESTNKLTVVHDGFIQLPNNTWKGAGVSVPVFSLRSKDSFGIGEFNDLKKMADWSAKTGMKLIQILPINDTTATHTWSDSYPYAAISAFALHPAYINLEAVAGKNYASLLKPLRKKQKELNALPEIDYEEVMRLKLATVKELYLVQQEDFLTDENFQLFFEKNCHWLVPYAAFCYLRDKYHTSDFSCWKTHRSYQKEAIEKLTSRTSKQYHEVALHYFIQYHLHLQLKNATDYAHEKGVIVKGDIPIGIYRYSCDAWVQPELYHMPFQAGAPPDDFAVKGQNWGFPTYNWTKMEEDGFAWWKRRFDEMSNYFDAFRIDHILGFFRIWSIPLHAVEGIMGRFVPAIPVHVSELNTLPLGFDSTRYTLPYITDCVLSEIAEEKLVSILKNNFLQYTNVGTYAVKDTFNTQRKVESHFATLEATDENKQLKQVLFDLLSNIILIEEPGSSNMQFHFRIAMENTSSFRHLDVATQYQLKELYVNYFFQRQDEFWEKEALHKLPALKASTNMLICGEDLGMVPGCVPDVMEQLGILSLEIQRMPKKPGLAFFNPDEAPYLAVVTPGTHDMSTLRGWWEEDRQLTQRFYNNELGQWGEAPYYCEPWINRAIILQHLNSPAMWSVFQLQDLLGMSEVLRRENPLEERINIPANPKHYWRYRMHITLEDLLKEKAFNLELKSYVEASGRC
jgi:4-alpha-glucanotransferase